MAKTKKMDPKLVALKQNHEVKFIAKKFGCTQKLVRQIQAAYGRSRAKVYARLVELGYTKKK